MTDISTTYDFGPIAGGAPASLVILLHGLGSNGQDLISLAPHMAQALPGTLFLSPDAPFPCDMVPPGYPDSYQWFSLQDRDPDKILAGVRTAAPILEEYIKEQAEEYGVPLDKVILGGFSQGCMMSLYMGLCSDLKLAGILGYSGALVIEPGTNLTARKDLPICLIHGEADDVVPVSSYEHSHKILTEAGFTLDGHSTPGLPHSIDEQGLMAGLHFVKRILR